MIITPDEIRKGRALADLAKLDQSSIIRKALDAADKLNEISELFDKPNELHTYGAEGIHSPTCFACQVRKLILESDKVAP